jgi:hypothetical protein
MKNKMVTTLLVVVLSLGIIFLLVYLVKNVNNRSLSSEETTLAFYSEWMNYEGNPMVDKIYQNNTLVTPIFSQKVDDIISSFDQYGAYDPILCGQDFPEKIEVKDSIVEWVKDYEVSSVLIEQFYSTSNKTVEVSLVKDSGFWQINDIICQIDDNYVDNISTEEKELVENYIKDNISDLSSQEAVLGGTFYVTDIRFLSSNRAIANYEDGHIALNALVDFSFNGGQLEIISFEVTEDDDSSFFKIGNIVLNGNTWDIVYEKPGAPALRERLIFTDNSQCLDERLDLDCFPNYWQNGDRVEINGKLMNDGVEVLTLRVVAENSQVIEDGGDNSLCIDNCGNGVCEEIVCMGEGCPCPETAETCPEDCI